MWRASCCSLVVTVMAIAVAITTAAKAATADGSSSDENLHQALVLVNILKSGILSRSRTVLPTLGNFADYAGYRPRPPPYRSLPFDRHGIPFRRMIDLDEGEYTRRKNNNATRVMEYEDAFGPSPGDDGQRAPDKATTGSKNPPTEILTTDTTPTVAKNTIQTTVAETKKGLNNKYGTTSAIKEKTSTAAIVTKKAEETVKTSVTLKATINTKTTGMKITSNPAKTSVITSTTKGEIVKTTKVIRKSRTKKTEDPKATSKDRFSTVNSGGIVRLKHQKRSDISKVRLEENKKITEEPEVVEAALELQREAADTGDVVQHRCPKRPQTSIQTGSLSPCLGNAVCNESSATSTSPRYKATPRVYLSRSSRPPVPLPANNAFCYTNPESPLCRTFI